ncbi:hypothetical protein QTN47_00440 [Danxiaibacter flavus]|uniref:Uncharacterized protein n=1 Tax=Danxiaibacter flavus TaxID=3049108 RepID=A0ABV3Z7V0_9BACT|nr:hypothetical protein QNM32_00440 [Chitinophagaceae bacterium DXS]
MNYISDNIFQALLDWSEAWITLIPLAMYFFRKKYVHAYKIVAVYLILAFINNSAEGFTIAVLYYRVKGVFGTNNWLYNLHSVFLTVCFILFFREIGIRSKWLNTKWILPLYLITVGSIFLLSDDFFIISSKVFAIEGIVLLVYCVSFFLQRLKDDEIYLDFDAPLVIVTGLTIYESVNFFIFLFFNLLMEKAVAFAGSIWDVHNWVYIIFCLFITYAFYGRTRLIYR